MMSSSVVGDLPGYAGELKMVKGKDYQVIYPSGMHSILLEQKIWNGDCEMGLGC